MLSVTLFGGPWGAVCWGLPKGLLGMRGIELSLDGLQIALLVSLQQEGLSRERMLPWKTHVVCWDHQGGAHPWVTISSTEEVHGAAAEELSGPGEQRGAGTLQVVDGAGQKVLRSSALTSLPSAGRVRRRRGRDAVGMSGTAQVVSRRLTRIG